MNDSRHASIYKFLVGKREKQREVLDVDANMLNRLLKKQKERDLQFG
jgi:hypothetical protein